MKDALQALVKQWEEQEQRRREQEQLEASLYRSRSRLHGSGLTEDQQEEKDFRSLFPLFQQVPPLALLVPGPPEPAPVTPDPSQSHTLTVWCRCFLRTLQT